MRLIFIGLLTISSILASSRCGFSDHLKYDDHEERISPPQLDTFAVSPTGHFYVHYDTTGNDAPNLADLDYNNIPDYVDESIATGNSSYWSWPGWYSSYSASHFDHILITNELLDEFDRPLSLCQTVLAEDYLQGGWQEYDSVVSDHRPVGIRLQFE